ncbi:hypothetical protein [Sphaerisporangium perillae]|uniref:hypothetical protein n=1 Tax=Sphaerisporangium perillae TaxID=2935860 RepID=UPI00200D23E3|nr:hypothetical protein [Sphaerisporangium perillae]
MPTAPKRRDDRAQRSLERERRIVEEAIGYCEDAIKDGALVAATDRVADHVSEKTWKRLTKSWSGSRCETLAQIARDILEGKDQIHAGVGKIASYVVGIFNGSSLERTLADEIAKRVPLPIFDEKMAATARGLQIIGMGVCFIQGYDLGHCACFVDVVKAEGKVQLKKIILASVDNWASLHDIDLAR